MLSTKAMWLSLTVVSFHVLAGQLYPATVGSLPVPLYPNNVFGLGDVQVPLGTSYPDFAFGARAYPYLVFGGSYDQDDWADWTTQVKYYRMSVDDYSMWTGVWVAGRGDLNGDENNDLLIGDPRHFNFRDWDENFGICYALYNIAEPMSLGPTELDLDEPGLKATVVEITTDQIQSLFGCCSQIVGDVNGDGYADIIVGESAWSPMGLEARRERYDCGRACLFYGSDEFADTSTTAEEGVTLLTGEDRNDQFGAAVSTAGLLNDDDAYADFAIGAPWYDKVSGETVTGNAGRVYVFLGDEDGITGTHATDANIIITGETADSFFGSAIGSGDFDGDGQGDLVVGAYGYDGQTGRAYVFFGSSLMADQDGLVDAADADVKIDGTADVDLFGSSVSTAGKFFGQMLTTDALIVGAPGVEDTSGAFYVFDMYGAAGSIDAADADYLITGALSGSRVGISVTDLTDVDRDLDSDVGVVASGYVLIHDDDEN